MKSARGKQNRGGHLGAEEEHVTDNAYRYGSRAGEIGAVGNRSRHIRPWQREAEDGSGDTAAERDRGEPLNPALGGSQASPEAAEKPEEEECSQHHNQPPSRMLLPSSFRYESSSVAGVFISTAVSRTMIPITQSTTASPPASGAKRSHDAPRVRVSATVVILGLPSPCWAIVSPSEARSRRIDGDVSWERRVPLEDPRRGAIRVAVGGGVAPLTARRVTRCPWPRRACL